MRSHVLAASLALAVAVPAALSAQTETFVSTLGRDTVGVEQVTWAGNTVTGDYITRLGPTQRFHYVATFDASHRLQKVTFAPDFPNGAPHNAIKTATVTFSGDSVFTAVMRDTAISKRFAAKGAYFNLGGSTGMPEIFLANMRATGADSAMIPLAGMLGPSNQPIYVKFFGPDSARIWQYGYAQRARVDRTGHILGVNGAYTTIKTNIVRTAPVDIAAMEAAFAAADKAGRGIGPAPSPRDTVNATVGTAHVWVDYGRPRTRGRNVFVNGVLGDTLWRTGANAATQFRTDADLVVGGKVIPAGTYTLWTHTSPNNSSYELVFNKQVGQWGTEYHPEQDFVRVPLAAQKLSAPVDAFTIGIVPASGGSALQMQWGDTQLSTPIALK